MSRKSRQKTDQEAVPPTPSLTSKPEKSPYVSVGSYNSPYNNTGYHAGPLGLWESIKLCLQALGLMMVTIAGIVAFVLTVAAFIHYPTYSFAIACGVGLVAMIGWMVRDENRQYERSRQVRESQKNPISLPGISPTAVRLPPGAELPAINREVVPVRHRWWNPIPMKPKKITASSDAAKTLLAGLEEARQLLKEEPKDPQNEAAP